MQKSKFSIAFEANEAEKLKLIQLCTLEPKPFWALGIEDPEPEAYSLALGIEDPEPEA